jgi:hypothetical protein
MIINAILFGAMIVLSIWAWFEWSVSNAVEKEFRTRDSDSPVV